MLTKKTFLQKIRNPQLATDVSSSGYIINLFRNEDFSNEDTLEKNRHNGYISLEHEVLPILASEGKLFAHQISSFWLNIKSAGSALYANREILAMYRSKHPDRLHSSENCVGNVYVHPSAEVDPKAVVRHTVYCIHCLSC